jgi:hypothetical protein
VKGSIRRLIGTTNCGASILNRSGPFSQHEGWHVQPAQQLRWINISGAWAPDGPEADMAALDELLRDLTLGRS